MRRMLMNILKRQRRHDAGGFSLIEVMMVVGIIAIIVTLAIPTTQSAVRSAKEAGCIKGLKVIYGSIEMYKRDRGYPPIQTSSPSDRFLWELENYLPESYHIGHGKNVMIKGYQLFGWVPDDPYNPIYPGAGPASSAGPVVYDRVGYRNWRVIAVPVEPYSGLSTFYLEPNGNVSKTIDGNPI